MSTLFKCVAASKGNPSSEYQEEGKAPRPLKPKHFLFLDI